MLLQLNPSIPVFVVNKGEGECIGWLDYGKEDHLIWIVAMDATGEVWLVPNPEIRFLKNYSIGRDLSETYRKAKLDIAKRRAEKQSSRR